MAEANMSGSVLTWLGLPATIDVATSHPVSFFVDATDADGINYVVLTLDHNYASGGIPASYIRFYDSMDSFFDGLSVATPVFDSVTGVGTYAITLAEVFDKVGNRTAYDTAELRSMGFVTTFDVVNTAPDVTAPVLSAFDLPKVLDVSSGQGLLDIHVTATDVSDLSAIAITFDTALNLSFTVGGGHNPISTIERPVTTIAAKPIEYGGYAGDVFFSHSGSDYDVGFSAGAHSSEGYKTVTSLSLTDKAGNTATFSGVDLARMGYNVTTDVIADTAPPVLTSLSLPHGVITKEGAEASFTIGASDVGSGVRYATLTFDHALTLLGGGQVPSLTFNDPSFYGFGNKDDFSDGKSVFSLDLDPAAVGSYSVESLTLYDGIGQSTIYYKPQLVAAGFATEFRLNDPVDHDFDLDGHSDILWQNANGDISTWSFSGSGSRDNVIQNSYYSSVAPSWHVAAHFNADGDSVSDLLWRNDDGGLSVWRGMANGSFQQAAFNDASVGNEWTIAAAGDLNGDGRDDILWRNANGAVSVWSSTGADFARNSYFHDPIGNDWTIAGVGDFNGDGRDDMLWRNANGDVSTWNGLPFGFDEDSSYASVSASWRPAGIGDFDGDGTDDIVWKKTDGSVAVWHGSSRGFDQGPVSATVGGNWQVAQTGDFNGDGKADILWRNADGAISVWHSNGTGFDQNTYFDTSVGTQWHVTGDQIRL